MNYWPKLNPFDVPRSPTYGWVCPLCNNVWAYWVAKCENCDQKKPDSSVEV